MAGTIHFLEDRVYHKSGDNANAGTAVDSTTLKLTPPQGYYDGSTDTVTATDADFAAANILDTANIFGVTGSVPVQDTDQEASAVSNDTDTLEFMVPEGYYDGTVKVYKQDTDFVAANIKLGTNIFGVTGSMEAGGGYLKSGQTVVYLAGDNGTNQDGTTQDYTDNSDNTITDEVTALTWVQEVPKIIPGATGGTPTAEGYWTDQHGTYDTSTHDLVSVNFPNWAEGVHYSVGDIRFDDYNYSYYRCKLAYDADYAQPESDLNWASYWTKKNNWADSTGYTTGDIVGHQDNYYYTALQDHTSNASNDEPNSGSNWTDYWSQSSYLSDWDSYTTYTTSDYIYTYVGGAYYVYKCSTGHTPYELLQQPNMSTDWATYWEAWDSGLDQWTTGATYTEGDIVTDPDFGTDPYYCIQSHVSLQGQPGVDANASTYWVQISDWAYNHGVYYVGDYVVDSATIYVCTSEHTSEYAKEPPNASYWDSVSESGWASDTSYALNDCVDNGGNYYRCILAHYSSYHQIGYDSDYANFWLPCPDYFICNTQHTAASDKNPYNASYWTVDPWTGSAANLTTPATMTWAAGIYWTNNLDYLGVTAWKVPHIKELQSLAKYNSGNPALDSTAFPNSANNYYHSSTTYALNTAQNKVVHFGTGDTATGNKTSAYYVRPVQIPA